MFQFVFSLVPYPHIPLQAGASDSPAGLSTSQSGPGSGRKGGAGPPLVRPGLSEGLEGVGGGRRTRLSLLDDLQEEEVCVLAWFVCLPRVIIVRGFGSCRGGVGVEVGSCNSSMEVVTRDVVLFWVYFLQ